jgi:hypothetical protein
MIYYRVYGLTFQSDCELPGLDRIQETSVVDYSLTFDDDTSRFEMLRRKFHCPWYISPWRVKCGRTVVEVCKTEDCHKFLFRFYDGIEFIIDRERGDIWVDGVRGAPLQAATHHLLFSLPGFLLGLRKSASLQGAAIGWRDGAVAFLGKSKSGKSVLSASMLARGFDVLSDDLVALDVIGGTVKIYPGYPWICLRSDSVHWLAADNLGALRWCSKWQYLDEAYVTWDLRRARPSQLKPRRLEAIYLLAPAEDPKCKPAIEPVPRYRALMALMEAADRTHIPYPDFRRQEFSLMGSVVAAVPTYRLRYDLSAENLPALSSLLQQHRGLQRDDENRSIEA